MKRNLLVFFILTIFIFLLAIVIFLAGGIVFSRDEKPEEVREVTTQVVLEKISTEAFVVSKTVYLDEDTTITIDKGSDWSNFWWGQEIQAEALIRVDIGVDYQKITSEDINIDGEQKLITINLPEAEILSTSPASDIEVVTINGVLRLLLANDPNSDYNLALEKLSQEAETAVMSDEDILLEAKNDSIKVLELVLNDLDYQIEILEGTN